MKKKIKFFFLIGLIFGIFSIFEACNNTFYLDDSYALIRIHIRANSNEEIDQNVKLKVRDKVVDFLTDKLINIKNFDEAYKKITNLLPQINNVCNQALKANNFNYVAHSKLNNEFFPTRDYNGIVVLSGYYDALIVELGSGKGNNWWCVIYPPMCFLKNTSGSSIKYKSFLIEFLKKFFNF